MCVYVYACVREQKMMFLSLLRFYIRFTFGSFDLLFDSLPFSLLLPILSTELSSVIVSSMFLATCSYTLLLNIMNFSEPFLSEIHCLIISDLASRCCDCPTRSRALCEICRTLPDGFVWKRKMWSKCEGMCFQTKYGLCSTFKSR